MSSASAFEEHFAREIIHSERTRMAVLAGVLAALIAVFALFSALYQEDYHQLGMRGVFVKGSAAMLALLGYELAVRQLIGRWLREGRPIPEPLRYLNAFVETSFPTLLIFLIARHTNPQYVLQGPAALLYGVFIVLSTLRLDFRLSVFYGVVAAAEYLALCQAYLGTGGEALAATPFERAPFFLAKAAVLLAAGFAAGFVAHQIKRRAGNAFRAQEERQRIVSAFGQQVSPQIVEELLRQGAEIASRRSFVCVMFMDIRNFTPMVEHRTPEEIVALQNEVFGTAVEVINRHHGVINQFLGDGFMATFGAPISTGNDCRNALAAARELVARVKVKVGIGLHAGDAVTGNVGSAERKQYSVTGNVVILASRIEQLNKEYDSQVLASREVLERAGEQAAALGAVRVKGHEQPIEIFRVA